MAAFNKFNAFVEALAEKTHNLGADAITVALTPTAPNATDSTLSQIAQIGYGNLSSRVLTGITSSQAGGLYSLTASNLQINATGTTSPFQYVVLYNDTATSDELIGYYNYGTSITLNNGESLTIDFQSSPVLTIQ